MEIGHWQVGGGRAAAAEAYDVEVSTEGVFVRLFESLSRCVSETHALSEAEVPDVDDWTVRLFESLSSALEIAQNGEGVWFRIEDLPR